MANFANIPAASILSDWINLPSNNDITALEMVNTIIATPSKAMQVRIVFCSRIFCNLFSFVIIIVFCGLNFSQI